jgi:ribosome-binding protein aMBF1 (putative translation factor)
MLVEEWAIIPNPLPVIPRCPHKRNGSNEKPDDNKENDGGHHGANSVVSLSEPISRLAHIPTYQDRAKSALNVVRLFGEIVRKEPLARCLTQQELAGRLEMERSYFSELERGRRNPTVRVLGALAQVLGVESWELLKP